MHCVQEEELLQTRKFAYDAYGAALELADFIETVIQRKLPEDCDEAVLDSLSERAKQLQLTS